MILKITLIFRCIDVNIKQCDQMFKFRLFLHFLKGNNTFSNLSKPFFNPIKGKGVFLAVLFAFARPPLNLHVSEVQKNSQRSDVRDLQGMAKKYKTQRHCFRSLNLLFCTAIAAVVVASD